MSLKYCGKPGARITVLCTVLSYDDILGSDDRARRLGFLTAKDVVVAALHRIASHWHFLTLGCANVFHFQVLESRIIISDTILPITMSCSLRGS